MSYVQVSSRKSVDHMDLKLKGAAQYILLSQVGLVKKRSWIVLVRTYMYVYITLTSSLH